MKYYGVFVIVQAKDEKNVKNKFIRDYDYYPIISIKELNFMKSYDICYYDGTGDICSVMVQARNERSARNRFIRDYGYYTIISIEELDL